MPWPIDENLAVMQIFLTFLLCSCMVIHSSFVNKKKKKSLPLKLSPKSIYFYHNSKLYIEGLWW